MWRLICGLKTLSKICHCKVTQFNHGRASLQDYMVLLPDPDHGMWQKMCVNFVQDKIDFAVGIPQQLKIAKSRPKKLWLVANFKIVNPTHK